MSANDSTDGGVKKLALIVVIFVVAGLGVLGFVVLSGGPKTTAKDLQQSIEADALEIEQMQSKKESKERRLARFEEKAQAMLEGERMESEGQEIGQVLFELEEEKVALKDEVVDVVAEFEEYRDEYRKKVRREAHGEIMDLSKTKGPSFKKSKVISITPNGVRVMRPSGPKAVPYMELPTEIRERFQFNQEEAEEYTEQIRSSRQMRAQKLADFRKKQQGLQPGQATEAIEKKIDELKADIQKKLNQARRYRDTSNDWLKTAARHWDKIRVKKQNGRSSVNLTPAKRAERKAEYYKGLAKRADHEAKEMEADLQGLYLLKKQRAR